MRISERTGDDSLYYSKNLPSGGTCSRKLLAGRQEESNASNRCSTYWALAGGNVGMVSVVDMRTGFWNQSVAELPTEQSTKMSLLNFNCTKVKNMELAAGPTSSSVDKWMRSERTVRGIERITVQ